MGPKRKITEQRKSRIKCAISYISSDWTAIWHQSQLQSFIAVLAQVNYSFHILKRKRVNKK